MKLIVYSLFLILTGVATLVSCQKDESDFSLSAIIADKPNEAGNPNAKVYIDPTIVNEATVYYARWHNGDIVNINNQPCTLSVSSTSAAAVINNITLSGSGYTAVYPYGAGALDGTTATVTIPATQTYHTAQANGSSGASYQVVDGPMVARCASGDNVLKFHNAAGIIRVHVNNTTAETLKVHYVSVESSDGSYLAGSGTVNAASETPKLAEIASNGSKSVTLDCCDDATDKHPEIAPSGSMDFYLAVAPFSGKQLKIKVMTEKVEDDGKYKYIFSSTTTQAGGLSLDRNQIGKVTMSLKNTNRQELLFYGAGTKDCPFLIESQADLENLRTVTNAGTSGYVGNTVYYKQTSDIELTDDKYSNWGSSTNYAIGNSSNPFSANYYGASHYVKLKVLSGEVENPIGIFGVVGGGGSISWLCSTGSIATIAKNKAYVGGITGLACGNFTFSHCVNEINYTTAAVSGSNYNNTNFGGICGRIDASSYIVTINDCRNKATLTKQDGCLGGICAYINAGNVSFTRDTNSGPINHNNSSTTEPFRCSGGILGYTKVDGTSFTSCINMGRITASANMVGGIVGSIYKGASFSSCINAAKISTNSFYAGGIMGYGAVNGETTATFVNCGNRDTISSTSTGVGGILGHAYNSTVEMSGCFSDENAYVEGTYDIGGLIGRIGKASTIKKCINRGDVKGSSTAIGGILGNGVAMITIEGCLNTGSVKSNSSSVGGIIGQVNQMKISLCRNDADSIKGLHTVGGIIGKVVSATGSETMDGCLNTGVVHATGASSSWMNVGGLIGWAGLYSMINSGNTGRISGTNLYAIAGLMGDVRYSPTIVKNCFNKSEIYTSYNNSAVKMAGLIYSNKCTIGNSTNPVLNCYFSGTLSCPHASATKVAFVLQNSSGYDVYYDYIYSPDGMGTTNGELKSGSYYSKAATIHARYHFNTNGSYATGSNTNTYFSSGKNLTEALNEWVNSQGEESGYYSWVDSDGDGIPVLVFPWPDSWNSSPSKRQRAHK